MLSLLVVKSFKISIYDDNKPKKFLEQVLHVHLKMVNYSGVVKGESVTIKGIEGRQIDLDIKLLGDDFESFAIDFGVSDSTYTRFLYNKKTRNT